LKRLFCAHAHNHRPRTAALGAFGAVFIAALMLAPGAFASTLTLSGGTLTYTPSAADATGVNVNFGEPAAGSVEVRTFDADALTGTVPGCTINTPGSGVTSDYTCTGVTSVVANGTGFADSLDASGDGAGSAIPPVSVAATLNGGAGADTLVGGAGAETLNGGDGNDSLFAGTGAETLSGGNGNDTIDPGNATDTVSGGPGIDQVVYFDNEFVSGTPGSYVATPVNVSLDGVANDGYAGNNSNIGTDVEDVSVQDGVDCTQVAPTPCAYGSAALTGDSGPNSLSGGSGDDTITGGGGGDFLSGNAGTNTMNAVNGYPDRVDCGGTGTANVDQLDSVTGCTTTNTTKLSNVGLITQDKAPTLSWTSPRQNARINPSRSNTFQVKASPGTHPITKVVYYVGQRTACIATKAPYKCAYKATDGDVGKDTLVAIATDSIGLTTTVTRTINVSTFKPKKLSASTRPKRAKHTPFRFTTSGRLTLPSGVSKRAGCSGKVSVTFRAGKKKVGSGTAKLRSSCTFNSRVKVVVAGGKARTLKVSVVFGGNKTLSRVSARGYKVKVG
jgi:Bacterial Ig domain/RTX calcium-binding nonapeptide repeat (4 copies)